MRADRELGELLNEIRVALPGLELLFGFLLILPFSDRFASISGLERNIYVACFLATACATALLIAPTARHRMAFRSVDKEKLVIQANRLVIAGLILIAVAIALATYLVVSVVLDGTWAAAIASALAGWFVLWWFGVPLWHQRTGDTVH
ncbi:MAG: hypothetical protein H0T89_07700 [Deltaproteobacteria bacterium]|nr:hypothetical protein [Deltaproteobacteria bacterium]